MIDSVEKTTIRKIYVRLLPLLFAAYFICYLDRINVGFAALTMNKAGRGQGVTTGLRSDHDDVRKGSRAAFPTALAQQPLCPG
jgi:hypothetical protein